ncbi:hypothetical protein [Cupriavidus numazuensis]|uniref:Uncharacterized protein n=1 Tax=Cupriavidus numazuensis TaxID=221992 RepID=A0ABM8TEE9_9BURK|nr:hypothetical protein [Cupriavidus numazuensis]CAG2140562.1 hypothetical protein LMG26411_01900 [Cupriavidus numazuensis]
MRTWARTFLAAALSLVPLFAHAADYDIMAWGLEPTPDSASYVTSLRIGCSDDPRSCLSVYKPRPHLKYFAIAVSKPNNAHLVLQRAGEYSLRSLQIPQFRELGIDDFLEFLLKIDVPDKGAYMVDLLYRTKSRNPKLNFGITLYEDQIYRKEIAAVPAEARNAVDRVALYLHYRENWEKYRDYVAEAKRLFPNARIYGGVYHYDRQDYMACAQGTKRKCTPEEESDLFLKSLALQRKMLQEGTLAGLELYPGFIGTEETWSGWSMPVLCKPERVKDCVSVSKKMGRETLDMFK